MTPYVSQKPQMPSSSTVILHHSDDSDEELENEIQDLSFSLDAVSSSPTGVVPIRRRPSPSPALKQSGTNTADKAGVILGIHNVFVVLPQFVVTLMASIIFHIMEPGTGGEALPVKHPNAIPIGNGTIVEIDEVVRLVVREGGMEGGSSDAVGLIFRYVLLFPY
jgi:solute carrier family 45 protein 1/2/4